MKKKITFIDVIIVLIIVVAAVIILPKFIGTSNSNTKTVTYTVMVTDVLPEIAEHMVAEDNVLLDAKDNAYGRVTAVTVNPSEDTYINLHSEKYVTHTTEELKTVFITVEADATQNDFGYLIGQQHIRIGEKQNVSAGSYAASGYIVGVQD